MRYTRPRAEKGLRKSPIANGASNLLHRISVRLFVCSGNHDWWSNDEITDTDANAGWLLKLGRAQVSSDNCVTQIGNVFVYCQYYAARAPFPVVETGHWILVHHEPPAGCAAAIAGGSGANLGSSYLRDQLRDALHPPLLVLSGHVLHLKSWRGPSGRSWVLNPCYDCEASYPNHLIIDLTSGIVTSVSERKGEWPVKFLV